MSDFQGLLDRAGAASTCQFLNAFGSSMVGYGAYALFAGGPVTAPLAIGAASLLAMNAGCSWDSDADGTMGPVNPTAEMCQEANGTFCLQQTADGVPVDIPFCNLAKIVSATFKGYQVPPDQGAEEWRINVQTPDGTEVGIDFLKGISVYSGNYMDVMQTMDAGSTCAVPGTPVVPDPVVYVDQTTGCTLNVTLEGIATDSSGTPYPVMKIEPETVLRNTGGIIGGCNFAPVIYIPPGGGGGGGGGTYIPIPDDPLPGPGGLPWWMDLIQASAGGVTGALIKTVIDKLLEEQVGGKVYRLTSVCETNAAGEPVDLVREVDIPSLSIMQAAIYRLDAIEYLLQGLKDFKQPTCRKLNYQGQLVSVDFKSDEVSPNGDKALRKLFRYRDQTDTPLPDHVAHWESFVWQAGPAIVIHKGAVWGVLKVWAADAEEGKRVIRHAGAIAGVNPDAEGEWEITSSSDPRYGQPGTMRIATRKSWGG